MSEIDLSGVVDEVTEELTLEKKTEIKRKIRHVADQVARFLAEEGRLRSALEKNTERLSKASGKIVELRKGNWNILSQINLQEKEQEGA